MIVVIGAGPAGLALAWALHRGGHEVAVLEAADHVGGMAASPVVSGIPVDLGSHRLHPSMSSGVRAMIDELVEVQERRRNGRIRLGERWVPFPLTAPGVARGLPAALTTRALRDMVTSPLRRPRSDSYASVVRSGLGPAVWRAFHEPYAWKLWDTDPTELSGDLARRRVSAATPGRVAGRVVRGTARRPRFLYPRDGFGALAAAMAAAVPDVRLRTRVTGLVDHGDRAIVGLADGRIVSASHVFSTVSGARTAAWLGAGEPSAAVVRTRSVVLVYLTLDRRPYTPYDAHYLPDRRVLPTRVSEPTNYRDRAADPADRTVLCAEIPCWLDDAVWRSDDADLGRRVADDLVRSGLPDPRAVSVETMRLPAVYPVMTPAAIAASARAEAVVDGSHRVTVLGRQGLFTPDDAHRVMEMGFAAASCVAADGTIDRDAWRRERDTFRDFVVDD